MVGDPAGWRQSQMDDESGLLRKLRIFVLGGGLEPWNFMTFHILGISSSRLTNSIIFRRGRSTTNQLLLWMIFRDFPHGGLHEARMDTERKLQERKLQEGTWRFPEGSPSRDHSLDWLSWENPQDTQFFTIKSRGFL